jgi:hypothetical protein
MINQVYTTVLAIINKDNRGYISPLEFNLYAEFAQMSLFEELFHKYSKSIVKQNARMYHSEFSDIPKHIREVIDIFTDETSLTPLVVLDPLNTLWKPLDSNFYRMIKMDYRGKEIEEISKLEINRILNNNLVQPTIDYPAYVSLKGAYRIYPTSVVKNDVIVTYIRKPSQPKWTYTSVSGNPLFNPTAVDYKDFELPESMFNDLVLKVLGYAGVEIREADIIQLAQSVEASNTNNEQL